MDNLAFFSIGALEIQVTFFLFFPLELFTRQACLTLYGRGLEAPRGSSKELGGSSKRELEVLLKQLGEPQKQLGEP